MVLLTVAAEMERQTGQVPSWSREDMPEDTTEGRIPVVSDPHLGTEGDLQMSQMMEEKEEEEEVDDDEMQQSGVGGRRRDVRASHADSGSMCMSLGPTDATSFISSFTLYPFPRLDRA